MGLSIWNLFEAGLLIVNAIAVLHEERFLNKIGWGRNQWRQQQAFNTGFGQVPSQPGPKDQLFNLIHSIRTLVRGPLIIINVLVIIYKLLLG